ncbi:MAG: DUF1003 domain-containing protein [Ferruginibacter sp.]
MGNTKKNDGIEEKASPLNIKESEKQLLKEGAKIPAVTIQKNIETILKLEKDAVRSRSMAENIADKITTFAGSTPFIIMHVVWFGVWISVNEGIIPKFAPFDPFPFSFLTLVVSLEAIFLTLLVLMSQNRMTKEADKRAHLDLQINMLDEQETTIILRMVQKIGKHLGLEEEMDDSAKDLSEETDINRVAKTLEEKSTM